MAAEHVGPLGVPASDSGGDAPERVVAAATIFAAFLRLGLTSFGGPIAHLGCFRADPVWTGAVHRPQDVALALVGVVPLVAWQAPPILVVAGTAGGLALG